MGQLIKLQDYISRYELDIFSYPARFARLKKQQWEQTSKNWENEGLDASNLSLSQSWIDEKDEEKKQPFFTRVRRMLNKNIEAEGMEEESSIPLQDSVEEGIEFAASFHVKPRTVDDLKQQFLDQLFRFQLKWASSTVFEKSNLHPKFFFDEKLKFFLQRFPDTFLILYKPIFLLQKAPVEGEIILITPTEVWCISFLEEEDGSVFIGSTDRFWTKLRHSSELKILNPVLALTRTEKIVRKILQVNEIDLPVHKLVLSRNGYIDYPSAPYDVKLVESRNFEEWFQAMRNFKSPLKHIQLKGAHSILQYCQTSSSKRAEWNQEEV